MMLNFIIFYNRYEWGNLLGGALDTILNSDAIPEITNSYSIYLSYKRGDNIKIAISCNAEHEAYMREYIYNTLQRFLINNSSNDLDGGELKPVKNFFMNFPNNSVYYYRDYSDDISSNRVDTSVINHQVSKIIKEVLVDEVCDAEIILTLFIYLQLTLIKAATCDIKKAQQLSGKLDRSAFKIKTSENSKISFQTELEVLIQLNNETLIEIATQVWENVGDDEIIWITDWEDACSIFVKTQKSIIQSYHTIMSIVREHLAITIPIQDQSYKLLVSAINAYQKSINYKK